ncbi:MAG TPA: hypothetical protein VLT32_15545 [Candidatus Sulfomarinibacteraceae bacterium]|nr:hypothetical protein [Candidatus Sulfomarinibacteraceae bacterium]
MSANGKEPDIRTVPRWPAEPANRRVWRALTVVAVAAAACAGAAYLGHVGDFFLSDDFELVVGTIEGASLLEPISDHLRPMVRLHFLLYNLAPTHLAFGLASLLLHAACCFALYALLSALYGHRPASLAALAQFACFLGSGAVFWASAVGILYCLLFSSLSLLAFVRGRLLTSTLLLVLAAASYELWLVVPPLMTLLACRRRDLVVPWVLALAYLAAYIALFGPRLGVSYGGVAVAELPVRLSISAFRLVSPFAGEPPAWLGVVLMVPLAALLWDPRFRFPVLAYAASAVLLSPASDFAGRFQYIPSAALVLILVLGLAARPAAAAPAAAALAGLLVVSPVVVWLDGGDYGRLAALHEELVREVGEELAPIPAGSFVILDNRLGPEPLLEYSATVRGTPKVVFVRGPGIGGMILPRTLVVFLLDRRGLAPVASDCRGTRIQVGDGPPRSHYCFRIRR